MDRSEMRILGAHMLNAARALPAAFPDADAMRELTVSEILPPTGDEDKAASAFRAAFGYLRDEMLLVRAGKANDLSVLDDGMALVGSLMPREGLTIGGLRTERGSSFLSLASVSA